MSTRKAICMVTASAVLMGAASGCSLFGGKDKTLVTDAVSGYIDMVIAGKYSKSSKFVTDEEDYFVSGELDETTSGILEAVFEEASYEIGDVEVNRDSASALAVFTLPDLQDGDYAFVLSDVNAESIYVIAYATVGN